MKVLMVVAWYTPKDAEVMSAGVFHYEQSMALKEYCDMALYYPYDTSLTTDFTCEEERGLLTYRRNPQMRNKKSIFEVRDIMSDLHRICKEWEPDIIHAHCGMPTGFVATLFGKKHGYPVVITEHNPIEKMNLGRKLDKLRFGLAYRMSQANVCVSEDSKNRLSAIFHKSCFQVIYNGVINPKKLISDNEIYAREGRVNACIVAAFYSLDIKGYQFLLPAIKKLKEEGIDIVLHICGGGEFLDYYVNMAKELGISENCIFYGACDRKKVYTIVSQMDFNISASIYECSGVSVQEALLLGKPLVVTKSGGANSLVNEETAIVVDRESVDALVDGIKEMIKKQSTFSAQTITEYAFDRFEIDQVSQQYMNLYNKLKETRK